MISLSMKNGDSGILTKKHGSEQQNVDAIKIYLSHNKPHQIKLECFVSPNNF